MSLEITGIKVLCGCCLEKTPSQPVVILNRGGVLIVEFPAEEEQGKSILLHLSYKTESEKLLKRLRQSVARRKKKDPLI